MGVEVPYKRILAGRQFPAKFLHLALLSGLTLTFSHFSVARFGDKAPEIPPTKKGDE